LNSKEEEALSKIKALVRNKVGARTREALVEAIGRALAASRPKKRQASSPTLAIGLRINPYEYRCQNTL
jgi:hypothetical protein